MVVFTPKVHQDDVPVLRLTVVGRPRMAIVKDRAVGAGGSNGAVHRASAASDPDDVTCDRQEISGGREEGLQGG